MHSPWRVHGTSWRDLLDRLRTRFAHDVTVFTGLDSLTLPLLRRLAETARNPRDVIVIEPDEDNALLGEARLTGARVFIGDPTSPRLLESIVTGPRRCALKRLYAVRAEAQENEAVVAAAGQILWRYQQNFQGQPHLVALIDDPRHAAVWRGTHIGTAGIWFEDALSSVESTACELISRAVAAGAREILLCGNSPLALAILIELARQAWELAEIQKVTAAGQAATQAAAGGGLQSDSGALRTAALPVSRATLLDPRSNDLLREFRASLPWAASASVPDVAAEAAQWDDQVIRTLDAKDRAAARDTAVIIVDPRQENRLPEAARVASLYPDTPVFVLTSPGEQMSRPCCGRLVPFEPGLLVDGEVPEDTWTRVARHWHECYRLSRPVKPGDPRTAIRLPWAEIDEPNREINTLQLRSVVNQVAALGRRWAAARVVPHGSFIELSDTELEEIATVAHTRWYRQRLAEGWSAATPASGAAVSRGNTPIPSGSRVNELLVPWAQLPAEERAGGKERARTQMAQLEDVGLVPVVPRGGAPEAARFDRVGVVTASRLTTQLRWTLHSGDEMVGNPGDWRIVDSTGRLRTVTDSEFRSSHEPVDDGRWRRVGAYLAWQVQEAVVIRTKEGKASARPGDWVVEGSSGERWPVDNEQFRSNYRPRQDRAATAGQASKPAAISSTTAPTISQ
jgi:hypothetical protein